MFKKGDRVKCIRPESYAGSHFNLDGNRIYTVARDQSAICTGVDLEYCPESGYTSDRFVLVDSVEKNSVTEKDAIEVGDTVECVNPGSENCTKGKTYQILEVNIGYNKGELIRYVGDSGYPVNSYPFRFKKVIAKDMDGLSLRVGDTVQCVKQGGNSCKNGVVYEVLGIRKGSCDPDVLIVYGKNKCDEAYSWRFRKVDKSQLKKEEMETKMKVEIKAKESVKFDSLKVNTLFNHEGCTWLKTSDRLSTINAVRISNKNDWYDLGWVFMVDQIVQPFSGTVSFTQE